MPNQSVLPRLKDLEWSMGNGQCAHCGGYGPRFAQDADITLGHKDGCLMADLLADYGDSPSMASHNKPNDYVTRVRAIKGVGSVIVTCHKDDPITPEDAEAEREFAAFFSPERLKKPSC